MQAVVDLIPRLENRELLSFTLSLLILFEVVPLPVGILRYFIVALLVSSI